MATQEERLAALEQTAITRTEFKKAIDELTWRQGRTLGDRNQETAISLGLLSDDVRILKENTASLRIRVNDGFADLSQELYSMGEKFDKRFVSLEGKVVSLEEKFERQTELLLQVLARLPEKP